MEANSPSKDTCRNLTRLAACVAMPTKRRGLANQPREQLHRRRRPIKAVAPNRASSEDEISGMTATTSPEARTIAPKFPFWTTPPLVGLPKLI
jgi:hypothetical protein